MAIRSYYFGDFENLFELFHKSILVIKKNVKRRLDFLYMYCKFSHIHTGSRLNIKGQ